MTAHVALVQRFIAHYRLPLFQKLHRMSAFDWTFFCDVHPGGDATGLPVSDLSPLPVRRIRNTRIFRNIVYQRGVYLENSKYQAILLDLGWTLISNPRYLLEAKLKGIKRIGWSKGIAQDGSRPKSWHRRAYERFILSQTEALVVYGEISREYFEGLGYPKEAIFVAQNTIDASRIIRERPMAIQKGDALRRRLCLDGRPVIGFLGKIAQFKSVDKILNAYTLARRRGMDASLVLAGNGPDRQHIAELIAENPFKTDIRFVTEVPHGEEVGYFQLYDLYCSFSQGGLGVLEAMAHGRVVLSTPERFPETELLESGRNALISGDRSVESFAREMFEAASRPTLRRRLGYRAEKTVAKRATQESMVVAIDNAVRFALAA